VFAAQDIGYLAGKTPQHHAIRVNDIPFAFNGLRIRHIGIQAKLLLDPFENLVGGWPDGRKPCL
jgi:hypothetical protein